MFDLEQNILSWCNQLRSNGHFKEDDLLELETHLRDEIDDLIHLGLGNDEAFIISVKRLGNVNKLTSEYSKLNVEKLWKQLFFDDLDKSTRNENRKSILWIFILSILAGTLAKIPELFGINMTSSHAEIIYFKNLSLFILPFITLFFILRNRLSWKFGSILIGLFGVIALLINLYPSFSPNNTELLTGIHLPLLLWLITGIAYLGHSWKENKGRMNFIRFTGETFIYGTLVLAGLMVLSVFIIILFEAIQINLGHFIFEYVLVYGGSAAALITVYLVETKKSIVENFAPILAKIFSPLFLISLLVFLAVMFVTGKSPFVDRNYLISFDLMLVLVLGLVLYVISSRNIFDKKNFYDYLNLALIFAALIIDGVALSAIIIRLSQFGLSPNKVAALGENIILLGNLVGLFILYLRFFLKKVEFTVIEKWQTFYLNLFAIWLAIVVFLFPILFGFK